MDNYVDALTVGIPAAIVLIFLPIWTVHSRTRSAKIALIGEIGEEIAQSSRSFDNDSLLRLNALIQRRDQILSLRNWPMDLSIFSRFILYVFIPPLAWAGGALMEVLLSSFLGI